MMTTFNQTIEERFARLHQYLSADPNNLSLLVELGDIASGLGRIVEAEVFFRRAHAVAPDDAQTSFRWGTALLATQQYEKAAALFRQMNSGDKHPAITYNLAYALVYEGHADESLEILDGISSADRRLVDDYDLLVAKAKYQKMEYAVAIEAVDRYLSTRPDSPDAHGLKAQLLCDTGKSSEATAIARSLLARNENDVAANLVLGSIAIEQRDANEARECFGRVVQVAPSMGRAWSGLGFAAMLQTKPEEAVEKFGTAVRFMPNHLGTWHGLAWALILLGDLVGARKAVDSAMELDRTFSENHGTLAVIEGLEGRLDIAEAEMKRGIRLNPRSAASQFARSVLLSQRGNSSGSQRLIKKILAPTGHDTDVNIAQVLIDQHWRVPPVDSPKSGSKPH